MPYIIMKQSIDRLLENIAGLNSFIETITSAIAAITSFAGIKAIVLLIGVMIISSIFASLGVRRGRASFFASLLTADVIWILWHKSFEPVNADFIFFLLKTNLILTAPLLIIAILASVVPEAGKKISSATGRLLKSIFRRNNGHSKEKIIYLLDSYKRISADLESSLMRDIIDADSPKVHISSTTKKFAHEVSVILNDLASTEKAKD